MIQNFNDCTGAFALRNTNLAIALAVCHVPPVPGTGAMVLTIEPPRAGQPAEVLATFGFLDRPVRHAYPAAVFKEINALRAAGQPVPPALFERFFNEWETGAVAASSLVARWNDDGYRAANPTDPIVIMHDFAELRAGAQKIIMDRKRAGAVLVHSTTTDDHGRAVEHYELPARAAAKG